MSFDIGINFRSTSGFVADGANETWCSKPDLYPIVRGPSSGFGWTGSSRRPHYDGDRDASVDRRLAGFCYVYPSETAIFRLDLPGAGSYAVHLALGDVRSDGWDHECVLLDSDGATVLRTVADGAVPTNRDQFIDAAGAVWSSAEWPDRESPVVVSTSGAALFLRIGSSAAAGYTGVTHLRVVSVGGGGPAKPIFRRTLFNRAGSRGIQ